MAKTVWGRPARPGWPSLSQDCGTRARDAILDTVGDLMSPHGHTATSHRDDLRRVRLAGQLPLLAPRQQGRDLHRVATTRRRSLCLPLTSPVEVPGADVAQPLARTPRAHSPASLSVRGSTDGSYRLAAPLTARTVRSSIGTDFRDLESHAPAQPALTPSAEPETCPVRGCSGAGSRYTGDLACWVAGRPSRRTPPRWPAHTQCRRRVRRPRPPRTLQ